VSVQQITDDAVLEAVRTAQWPPTTAELAHHFGVIPASHTLQQTIERLVDAVRLTVASGWNIPVTWAVA